MAGGRNREIIHGETRGNKTAHPLGERIHSKGETLAPGTNGLRTRERREAPHVRSSTYVPLHTYINSLTTLRHTKVGRTTDDGQQHVLET